MGKGLTSGGKGHVRRLKTTLHAPILLASCEESAARARASVLVISVVECFSLVICPQLRPIERFEPLHRVLAEIQSMVIFNWCKSQLCRPSWLLSEM